MSSVSGPKLRPHKMPVPRGPNSHLWVPVARKSQPRSGMSTSTAPKPCTPSTQKTIDSALRLGQSVERRAHLLDRQPDAGRGVHPGHRDHLGLGGHASEQPRHHLVDRRLPRVVVERDARDRGAGTSLEQPEGVLCRVEVVRGREHLVAGPQREAAVHQRDAHRGRVGERVVTGGAAGVVGRGLAHGVLELDALEQGALGVEGQPLPVVVDGGVDLRGVRREHERRELCHGRVQRELCPHRLPVGRVELRDGRRGGGGRCLGSAWGPGRGVG